MHEILDAVEEINVDEFEYAILLEDTDHNATKFNMFLPKLMPLVQSGNDKPKSWKEKTNAKIFVNDSGCKIAPTSTVTCQNFVTIKQHTDTGFSSRANSKDMVPKGTKFVVHCMNGNYRDLYVTKVI